MSEYILYTAATKCPEFVNCLQLLISTLELYTQQAKPLFDILILHDDTLEASIKQYCKSTKFNIFYHKPNSVDYARPEFFLKLKYFDYTFAYKYKKALYLDADILVTTDVTQFFQTLTTENKLYVYPEDTDKLKHDAYYYNPYYPMCLNDDVIEKYEINHIYVFNSGTFLFEVNNMMKLQFDQVINLIVEHKQSSFMDQPFLNYYFNQIQATEYMFNANNYKLGVDETQYFDDCILHFTGNGIGEGAKKLLSMFAYFKQHIQPLFNYKIAKPNMKLLSSNKKYADINNIINATESYIQCLQAYPDLQNDDLDFINLTIDGISAAQKLKYKLIKWMKDESNK